MITQLGTDPGAPFPPVENALDSPDGLLAWGGDLEPVRLVNAYHHGIFPWYSEDQPILWWSPLERCVLFPQDVHISRRLARVLRQQKFTVTADRAFDDVIAGCALPRKTQETTWITPEMIKAYVKLHEMEIAHSIEVWAEGVLQGGLYGLSFGRIFIGESMFSVASDASKVALVALCRQLQRWRFEILDCQIVNPHLSGMGAFRIHRNRFLEILERNIRLDGPQGSWAQKFEYSHPSD